MRFWLNWGAGLVASMIAVPALAAGQQPIDAESMEVFFDRVWGVFVIIHTSAHDTEIRWHEGQFASWFTGDIFTDGSAKMCLWWKKATR